MTSELAATASRPELVERAAPFNVAARGAGRSPGGDGLTLEGYASVWDSPATIRSWEGTFTEEVARGAFADSLRVRTPVVQFDHGHDPRVGSTPIAALEALREDSHGLFVRARLLDNDVVTPVRQAIAAGAISGMSIRFAVVVDEWRDSERGGLPHRILRQVDLHEMGPVVFPAYPTTSVGVRGTGVGPGERASQLRELWLRRVHGRWAVGGP